ncbi:hypothetical protein [Deinococcus hopiensis]|nr:hypothetical protein [Deinococcus hopiensis]
MRMTDSWPAGAPAPQKVYFLVENTDHAVEAAQASSGEVPSPGRDLPYGRLAVLQDPKRSRLRRDRAVAGSAH